MLTFFRRIRKSYLDSSQARKYIQYAIGEITLVVFGILIALQINNWNENRKTEKLIQDLYVMLRASLMTDTADYNNQIERYEVAMENSKFLQEKISIDAPYSIELDTALATLNTLRSYESDDRIFDRILAVGIENIKDNTLTNELQHYYDDSRNFVRYGAFETKLLNEIYPKYFTTYHWQVAAKPADWEQLKTVNEFRVLIDRHPRAADHLIERTEHRKDLARFLLRRLDQKIVIKDTQKAASPFQRTMVPRDTFYLRE